LSARSPAAFALLLALLRKVVPAPLRPVVSVLPRQVMSVLPRQVVSVLLRRAATRLLPHCFVCREGVCSRRSSEMR
jgi:hypothetical protein